MEGRGGAVGRHTWRGRSARRTGWGRVSPNPMVGAVVVRRRSVVGEGWHEGPGARTPRSSRSTRPGTERAAPRSSVRLEPCDHSRPHAAVHPGADRGRGRHGGPRSPIPTRWWTAAVHATPARGRDRGRVGLLRARSRPAERRVPAPRPHGPAVRAMEDGRVPGRQGGRPRRVVALDHRGGRAPRRAPAPGVGGRDRGRGRHGARRRPGADRADSSARGRGPRCGSLVDGAGGVPATGALFDARRRRRSSPRRSVVRRPRARSGEPPEPRCSCWTRRSRAGSTCAHLLDALGKRDVQGVLLEGGPTLAWASFVRGSWTRSSRTSRPNWWAAPARRGRWEARGSRRSPRRSAAVRRRGARSATTFEWRPMFTGIVEELGTVRSMDASRLVRACRVVAADARDRAIGRRERCLPDGGGASRRRAGVRRLRGDDATDEPAPAARRDPVNLERPATLGARLGGHLVQGHVDGVGEVVGSVRPTEAGGIVLTIPAEDCGATWWRRARSPSTASA